MTKLIAAIERFEAALRQDKAEPTFCPGRIRTALAVRESQELEEAEKTLCSLIGHVLCDDHDGVCEPRAQGCTEGVTHNGTTYAPGFRSDGEPCVVLLRRTRAAIQF